MRPLRSKTPTARFICKICGTAHRSFYMKDLCEQLCMKAFEFEPKKATNDKANLSPKA